MSAGLETVPLAESDVASGFRSGVAALDEYFSKHAWSNDRRGVGKTFVLKAAAVSVETLPPVVGYYTLSMAVAEPASLPKKAARGLPAYSIPVALIGRLAVDERARGQGYGARLLRDALIRIVTVAVQVGCFGVVVDAKDAAAVSFYEKYGFVAIGSGGFPRRMFIAMKTVMKAFD